MWCCNRFAVWRAGGRAKRLTPRQPADLAGLDGLIIGGGDDIDARLYGGSIEPEIRIDEARDALELTLLSEAYRSGLPVLGICRGAQMINVMLGGTLIGCIFGGDLGAHRRTVLPLKTVDIHPRSRLARLLSRRRCRVNALHHQAVDRPAARVEIVARDRAGIIQAIEVPTYPFLIGVQWHPEFLILDRGQARLFRALVAAAGDRRDRLAAGTWSWAPAPVAAERPRLYGWSDPSPQGSGPAPAGQRACR
jgi:putative glutamine amidotransferase